MRRSFKSLFIRSGVKIQEQKLEWEGEGFTGLDGLDVGLEENVIPQPLWSFEH